MAGADVIEAAVGITLLLIVSYVVLGSITTAATTVGNARKDMTLSQEKRLGTKIEITSAVEGSTQGSIWFITKNTGNTIIDYSKMNFIVATDGSPARMYFNTMGSGWFDGTWDSDNIHYAEGHSVNDDCERYNPNQWDPGEYLYVWIGVDSSVNEIGVWAITPDGATSYHGI